MSKDDMPLPGDGRAADKTVANKPVAFPPREDQVRSHDDAFYARLAKAYDTVKITAQPVPSPGERRSDIERPEIAADEARIRLSAAFPGRARRGEDRAAVGFPLQQGAHDVSGKGRRAQAEQAGAGASLGHVCRDHANAEREYFQAGYRPALVTPTAIDFSDVKLTDRERKAVNKARGSSATNARTSATARTRLPDPRREASARSTAGTAS